MAYDAQSAYIAPRRAYMGGQPAPGQPPVPNGYGNPVRDEYGQYGNPYMEQQQQQQSYERGYGGYGEQYGQNGGYEQQQYGGNAGYTSGQVNGYGGGGQQQGSERQYDPRYQQRSDRGRQAQPEQQRARQGQQPGNTQQRGREQRQDQYRPVMGQHPTYDQAPKSKLQKSQPQPQPQIQPQPQPETQYQMQQSRPNPRNARNYGNNPAQQQQYQAQAQPQNQALYQQQNAGLPAPPRITGEPERPHSAPGSQQMQPPSNIGKNSMSEWKAKEKARMHAEAMLPDTIAQDNAFPVFPTTRERSKVRGSGEASPRGSGELQRPTAEEKDREKRHERKRSKARTGSDAVPPSNLHDGSQVSSLRTVNASELSQVSSRGWNASELSQQSSRGFNASEISQQSSRAPYASDVSQQSSRPPLDHKPYSFDEIQDRSPPMASPPQQSYSEQNLIPQELSASPVQTRMPQGWPQQEDTQSYAPPRSGWAQTSSQNNAPVPDHLSQFSDDPQEQPFANQRRQQTAVELSAQTRTPPPQGGFAGQQYGNLGAAPSYQNQASQAQSRQPLQKGVTPQPIDTRLAQQPPKPAFLDHQPLSPASLPQRPSTSQGQRSAPTGQPAVSPPMVSPLSPPMSASLQSQMPQNFDRAGQAEVSKGWGQQQQQRPNHDDVYGIYNPYDDNRVQQTPVAPAPRTREEEIEAEMPDFDSAAPGGTSLLHKRSQINEAPRASPPPPMPTMAPQDPRAYGGMSPSDQRGYNTMSPSDPRGANERPPEKFVYGQPGQNNPRKYGASYNQTPPAQSYNQSPPSQPYNQPPPAQSYQQRPPQPPFANEQPRRSMDDARQMPYRQGPPAQQRSQTAGPPTGHPPPGSLRQHRSKQPQPGGDRNFNDLSVQTSRSDPPGSAPPGQQSFREQQLRQPNGQPGTRRPSEPSRPMPEQRSNDPDALPHHPTPVRPGHMDRSTGQTPKPAPMRNHDNAPPASHQRQVSSGINRAGQRPVTAAELQQLQAAVNANPGDQKRTMLLIKKLVEASTVLAGDGGRADPRTQAKNREQYIMDADKRLRKLVATGYPDAQFFLADCYGSGAMGLPVNPKEAFTLYQAAAKAGHAQAAYRTAMCCELGPEDGGTSKDYGKAVQWYRRGAALGDPDAMFKIGIILLKGLLGQPRNVGEAVNFLKRAVDQTASNGGQGNPQALFELAQLYESSQTNPEIRNKVLADDKYAFDLFHQAAAGGQKAAQFRLGQAYEYGNMSVAIDNRASITWYTKSAAQGDHQAELALSGWYLTGAEGILQQSDQEAYLWARKAAGSEPPLAKALFAMGYFTEMGIGCPRSLDEAKKWYSRAASQRFPKAHERLQELQRNGSKVSRPVNGKLSRKDQKKDEENCVVM